MKFIPQLSAALSTGRREDLVGVMRAYRTNSQFREFMAVVRERRAVQLLVMREEVAVSNPILRPGEPAVIEGTVPGHYTLQLASGRVLWEGELSSHDLQWAQAHEEEDLKLAAASEDGGENVARVETLGDGEITLTVTRGVESGHLELRFTEEEM